MVLAPEHPLTVKVTTPEQAEAVEAYRLQAARQSDIQREAADKEKTGIFTGGYAINPVNRKRIPIWIADYVLMSYGTGAIMGVPAHDERDFEFALKFGLPILPVIERIDGLTKSFALNGSMKPGLDEALEKLSIPYEQSQDGLLITIPVEKVAEYTRLAHAYLQPGWWNEIVGGSWIFIFSDGIIPWDSFESEERILARCKQLYPAAQGYRTLMELLWSCPFYRDALYHHEYGRMINSGEFTGTPVEQAMQSVTGLA